MEIFIALAIVALSLIFVAYSSPKIYSFYLYVRQFFGDESQLELLFVADAENDPEVGHDISDPALFRFLLNEETIEQLKEAQTDMPEMLNVLSGIDKQSKITLFGTYQSSMGSVKEGVKAFHVFIVFQTESKRDGVYWWSLEKSVDYSHCCVPLQAIAEKLKGKGSIRDLFDILWIKQVIPENYHIFSSNCQSFVTLVSKRITEEEYEYKDYFKYSISENDRKVETLNLINVLTGITTWHPLVCSIFWENTKLLDSVIDSGVYDINATPNGNTLLNWAITFSKSKMVRHLLVKWKTDPTKSSELGLNALHTAAIVRYKNMDIIDLLLAQKKLKIDQRSKMLGMTALYLAI
jgi:hypothetical protein